MDAMAQHALIQYEVDTKHVSTLIWDLQQTIVKVYDRETCQNHFHYMVLLHQSKLQGKEWLVTEKLRHEKMIKQGITFK